MAKIILFRPRYEHDPAKNLDDLIEHSRNKLFVFGADLNFDSDSWDLTETVDRAGMGNKRDRVTFYTLDAVKSKLQIPMDFPFRPFAKAYMRYSYGLKPTKTYGRRLSALRMVEFALKEAGGIPDPTRINAAILNRAIQLAAESETERVAYQIGGELSRLAKFMTKNWLLAVPTLWRNPIKKPSDSVRVGVEFDKCRAEKMPSEAALRAVVHIFRDSQHPTDILVSSAACILLASPSRASELLTLPEDCEVHQTLQDGTPVLGLRWWPAKGAPPMLKYAISCMVELVQSALQKIRSLTEPARQIAAWYENNPQQVYLPEEFEHLRAEKWLEPADIKDLFSLRDHQAAKDWCVAKKLKIYPQTGGWRVLFVDFERAIISMLPKKFPIYYKRAGLPYSKALMVVRLNELHNVRSTNRCMFEPISINLLNYGLGSRAKHGGASIFTRNGWAEADGSPMEITSHQFRHHLNTIALSGNMNPVLLALWSGRKDIKQNAAYDHQPSEEIRKKIRDAIGDSSIMIGPLSALPENIPISRDEFAILQIPTAHTTDFGYCVHDYTMSPCLYLSNCIHCEDLVCIKGDAQKTCRIRRSLDEALILQAKAEEAVSEGYTGSGRWSIFHKTTVERLQALWDIIDDPDVPMGAVIQLRKPQTENYLTGTAIPKRSDSRRKPRNRATQLQLPK